MKIRGHVILSIMLSSPVFIAFLTHINNANSNRNYLKLAEQSLLTILWWGFPPGCFTQVKQTVKSDAH